MSKIFKTLMVQQVPIFSLFSLCLAITGCQSMANYPVPHTSTQVKQSIQQLVNKTWEPLPTSTANQMADNAPNIYFDGNNQRFNGYDGCNYLMGSYQADDHKLILGPIASTMRACLVGNTTSNQNFAKQLEKTRSYSFKQGHLILLDSQQQSIIQLHQIKTPQ